jgi:hypothetical protein
MTRFGLGLFLALHISGCGVLSSDSGGGDPQNALTMQVGSQPPADKTEDKPASPGFGYIWVSGYWDYIGGQYVWRNGRWVQGKPDYEYVRARYEYDGKGWTFHRPHWKKRKAQEGAPPPSTPAS